MSKEEQILQAAVKIFSEKGYSASTTSEIARIAGVAEGTIFRYFKTKKDLLRKVMVKLIQIMAHEFITNRLGKLIKDNSDMAESDLLKLLLKDRMEVIVKHWSMIKIVFNEIQYHEDLKAAFVQNFAEKGKEILGEFYNQYVAKGVLKNYDSTLVMRSFVGIFGIYIIQRQAFPEIFTMDDDKQVDIIINIILYGISNRGGVLNDKKDNAR
ncbi:MAG: TetR/AcrR family transcriptional regulator [Bacillota bacterium]|nr:TetR/AcrR family transcriptional regulator [Bacillota bacterium]